MRLCQLFVFCVLLSIVVVVTAQTSALPGVIVKLSLADNKTVYKIGEPISLVMEFTANREGYIVEYLPDGKERGTDEIVVTPDTGVTRWLEELNAGGLGRDYLATDKLTASPKRVEFFLNDTLRFDTPGHYTVRVKTRRVWPVTRAAGETTTLVISTNAVTFEAQPMTELEEEKEVKRIVELLDAKPSASSDDGLVARQLSYLTGDASTQEKVKRFLTNEDRGGNFHVHMFYGLFVARNRSLAVKLLEAAMRDPNRAVTSQLLGAATTLKASLTEVRAKSEMSTGGLFAAEDPRVTAVRDTYVMELAAGLGKRSGESQTTTAMTVLTALPKDSQAANAGLREIRHILIEQFDSLNSLGQERLLQYHWEQLRDPSLIPSLKKMLTTSGPLAKHLHEAALKRLLELAPEEAKPYVITEIRDPRSLVDPEILGQLKDESLPELDMSLLAQVRALAETPQLAGGVFLKVKAALLVRFATANIVQSVLELYRASGAKLERDSRAGLLAYLAKHNDREALPLIEQAVSEYNPQHSPWVLNDLTKLYYSESIGTLLKKLLESDVAAHASHAAYLIGREGYAGDEKALEARLKRWREEWGNRAAEAEAELQGQLERELIYGLTHGKSWKLPPERVKELQRSCITKMCKDRNPTQ